MTPAVAVIFALVTLALVGASVWLSRRGRDGTTRVEPDAFAQPEAAPWEREGGKDLTAPAVVEPPAGARIRAVGAQSADDVANAQLVAEVERGLQKIPPLPEPRRSEGNIDEPL